MPPPKTPGEMTQAIIANLKAKTGQDLDAWIALLKADAPVERKARIAWLKSERGVGHVTAQIIALAADGEHLVYEDPQALVDTQYAGPKAALRPIYEALVEQARALGEDVSFKPCATYVPLIRRSQFAVIQPSTRTRVDVGLKLLGVEAAGRLQPSSRVGGGLITHAIALGSPEDIDDEVLRWLRAAYEANGAERKIA